ncbi:MAG: hypothetical protein SGI77_14390 [Pirellulaceae bacterium]|nr:hypothetical protein [Pirellulaceae bacterium]
MPRLLLVLFSVTLLSLQSVFVEAQDQVSLRIRFGMRDQEPTDWSGSLTASSGKVETIRGWRWQQEDSASGNKWSVRTRRGVPQSSAERARIAAGLQLPMSDNGILVTLSGCDSNAEITIDTKPAQATIRLNELLFGKSLTFSQNNLLVERVPTVQGLATTMDDEDYPSVATSRDGTVYAVYLSFTRGRDFQGARERPATSESEPSDLLGTPVRRIEQPGDLAYLAQPTGGEQIYLRIRKSGGWSEPIAVTDGKNEYYRPSVSVAGDGRVCVFYSAHLNADENLDYGNWELMAKIFAADGSKPSQPINISSTVGTDFMPASATDSNGQVWVTWIGARGSNFHLFTSHQNGDKFTAPERVSQFQGNEWEPAIAADVSGQLAVAWDTFEKGDYDVYTAVRGSDGKLGKPQAVAASLGFEVRPSLTYDSNGRLWIAYEYSGDQWGKDFGALKHKGIPLYQTGRSLGMKVLDKSGQWFTPEDVMQSMPDLQIAGGGGGKGKGKKQKAQVGPQTRSPVTAIAPTYPRLASDGQGNVWLAFRGKPGGSWRVGVGSVWCEYIARLDGKGWSDAAWIPHSNNILDNRPALTRDGNDGMMLVFSGDGRGESNPLSLDDVHLPGSSDDEADNAQPKAKGKQAGRGARAQNQIDPNNNMMFSTISSKSFDATSGDLQLSKVSAEVPAALQIDISDERSDIQRMRDYRVQLGDESLRIWRGEFHRHTELSPDGGGDGGLLDMWRYAIDAAGMDWIGDGDHDYGNGREYSWWTTQKAVTLYTLPDHFVPIYSYERSVRYPEGHRNCMFANRGVRSLPRLPISSPDVFAPAPDTNLLYKYLHYFGGLCASHTSATDMGTDWRNHDPVVEPFVEIYQGDRNNYERPDSPRSAVTEAKLKQSTPEKESLGGWRPKGFVNLALLKGYRLAFQSSSDHISTHLSYCNVLVTEPTRAGLLDAIRKRRVYGSTDNIVADVRCKVGDNVHFMGEEFSMTGAPTIDVRLIGSKKIANVIIIKDDVEVYRSEPMTNEVRFQWTDPHPSTGKTSYYYVRGEQVADLEGATAGELVWASPMWILVK